MKIDYYTGSTPITVDQRVAANIDVFFTYWYEIVQHKIDTKVLRIDANPNCGLFGKIRYRISRGTAIPLLTQRRKGSILHIVSVNLVNIAAAYLVSNPLVVSCADAILYEDNVETLTTPYRWDRIEAHKKIMKRADRIITMSEYSKTRLSELIGLNQDKIDVIYNGINHQRFYPRSENNMDMRQFGFDPTKTNLLYVGSESSRKNLERLFHALAIVKSRCNIKFVKVGPSHEPYHSELRQIVDELGLSDIINFHGMVTAAELPLIYNMADLFIFPTYYEGFGFPPLEAMACGCPVVTSSVTSLPEVVGDAAEIVDPYDHESIAAGILKVLGDEQYRQKMIQNGRQQALRFNWETTAADILNVYNKL